MLYFPIGAAFFLLAIASWYRSYQITSKPNFDKGLISIVTPIFLSIMAVVLGITGIVFIGCYFMK